VSQNENSCIILRQFDNDRGDWLLVVSYWLL